MGICYILMPTAVYDYVHPKCLLSFYTMLNKYNACVHFIKDRHFLKDKKVMLLKWFIAHINSLITRKR